MSSDKKEFNNSSNSLPTNWQVKKVVEIAEFLKGKRSPAEYYIEKSHPQAKPYVRITDFGKKEVSIYTKADWCLECESTDTLIATDGSIGISDYGWKGVLTHHILCLRPDKNIVEPFYLYSFIKSKEKYMANHNTASVSPTLRQGVIKELEILLPPLNEQKKILGIIQRIYDKIELNYEMNKTLEEIGQALFKRWFIDFEFPDKSGNPYKSSGGEMLFSEELGKEVPKGWEVGKLGDYVILVKGVSYKSEELSESENALVTLKSIDREGNYNTGGLKEYVGKYKDKQILSSGDIVVAHTDLTQKADVLGKPAIIREDSNYEKLIASLDLVIVRPKSEHISRPFIYHLLKTNTFHNHAKGYANGTTVLHLNQKAIPDFEFVVPSFTVPQTFGEIINKITLKIQDNELQSEYLAQIRDSLLPKLMSGEIRVPLEAAQ